MLEKGQPCYFFKEKDIPGFFLFIFVFLQTIYRIKTVASSRIRTWIVGVEGEHGDHHNIPIELLLSNLYLTTFIKSDTIRTNSGFAECASEVPSCSKLLCSI